MRWMAPLQSKLGKGEGTEAETIQVEFTSPHKTKSKVQLSREEQRKLLERKEGKKKKEHGLEAFGGEREGQSSFRRFFQNPLKWLIENPQLTFDDIRSPGPAKPEVTPAKDDLKPRDKLAAELRRQADELEQQIMKEIHSYKPMGKMSEFAEALHMEPKKGEPVQTPFGLIVFAKDRSPDKKTVESWEEKHKKSDELRSKALQYSFSIIPKPNITTGNFRVVEQGKRLHEQGLLTPEEIRELEKLDKFWQEHPELDRQKEAGMWNEKLELVPWKSSTGKLEKPAEKSWEFKPNDGLINRQLADRSHMGTSWDPEKRAEQEIAGFVQDIQAVFDRLKPYARTEAQKALLIDEMQRFQTGYAQKYNEKLAAHGRTISSFITGASRFPTGRAEKANRAYEKKFQDMLDWKDRAEKAIIRKLKGEAIEEAGGEIPHLQKKLAQAEKLQEMMVEANKIIRKKHEPGTGGVSKHKQLVDLGFSEKQAAELLIPDFAGRKGFSYHLTNNSAEIRRLKDRIAQLEKKELTQTREFAFAGGHILDNQEDDRVQIFFDQKPSQDVISKLKGEGWRWSPSNRAWQRKRTEYALMSANRITGAQVETQFKDLQKNPRDVIGNPPNFIMKMQLFKLWKEVLGAEDIGDFETFMKEAADLTYDEAKEKLLKTYGQPGQMTTGAKYFGAKASEAEGKLHAGMCSSAAEECGKGDPEACEAACEDCGLDEFCSDVKPGKIKREAMKRAALIGKGEPGSEVKEWMRKAHGIQDYKGVRSDRIGVLRYILYAGYAGNITDRNEALSMAIALGEDLGYGRPPEYGISIERYYAEKIANETGQDVPIIKGAVTVTPTRKEAEYREPEYEIEKWYLLYAPHLKDNPYQLNYMIQGSWGTKHFRSFKEAVGFMQKGESKMYVHRVRGDHKVKWKSVKVPNTLLKEGYRKLGNKVFRLEQPHFRSNEGKWFWSVYVIDLNTGETNRREDISDEELAHMDKFSETELIDNTVKRYISEYDMNDYTKAEIGELHFIRNLKETLKPDLEKLPSEKQERYGKILSEMVEKAKDEIIRREQAEKSKDHPRKEPVKPEDEYHAFGTKVLVKAGENPELEPAFRGTIIRTLNDGKIIEVRPEGQSEGSFRVDAARVIVDRSPQEPKKESSWRKFPDRKSETKAVKEALKKAGIDAEVRHGTGTSWGWLEINIGDPRMRGGLKPPPFEYQYTDEEQVLHNKVIKIAQEVTGRHGDYDGRISLLAQGWRKSLKPDVLPEKEKVSIEGLTKDAGRLRMIQGPLKGKTAFRCPECMRGLADFVCGEHGRISPEEALDLRKIKTDPKTKKRAKELFDYTLDEAREAGFPTVKAYYDSLKDDGFKQFLKLAVGLEEIFGKGIKQEISPAKITPEVPRSIPEAKHYTAQPEPEGKPAVEVKPKVETKKHKRTTRKSEMLYTEYGRTVVKKAKSGVIRLTDADMKADAIYISY